MKTSILYIIAAVIAAVNSVLYEAGLIMLGSYGDINYTPVTFEQKFQTLFVSEIITRGVTFRYNFEDIFQNLDNNFDIQSFVDKQYSSNAYSTIVSRYTEGQQTTRTDEERLNFSHLNSIKTISQTNYGSYLAGKVNSIPNSDKKTYFLSKMNEARTKRAMVDLKKLSSGDVDIVNSYLNDDNRFIRSITFFRNRNNINNNIQYLSGDSLGNYGDETLSKFQDFVNIETDNMSPNTRNHFQLIKGSLEINNIAGVCNIG